MKIGTRIKKRVINVDKNTVTLDIDRYNELLEKAIRYELIKESVGEVTVNGKALSKWIKQENGDTHGNQCKS